jgi:CBS domain-containing protein
LLPTSVPYTPYDGLTVFRKSDSDFHVVPAGTDAAPASLDSNVCVVSQDTPLIDTLRKMNAADVLFGIVTENSNPDAAILGVITEHEIAEHLKLEAELL